MDNKTYGIGILSLTGVALLIANLFAPRPAIGIAEVSNTDMQAVTAPAQGGGDALYLLDKRSGKLAVFTISKQKGLIPVTVTNVDVGFREAAAGNAPGRK